MSTDQIRNACRVMAKFYDTIVDAWYQATPKELVENSPCKPSCWYCCQQMVFVTIAEAMYLLDELFREHPRGLGLAWFAKNAEPKMLEQMLLMTRGRTSNENWFKKKIRCIFLTEQGLCRVYAQRPLACRTHRVLEGPAERCDDVNERLFYLDDKKIIGLAFEFWQIIANDLRISLISMPLPFAVFFALVGLSEGIGAMRKVMHEFESRWMIFIHELKPEAG